MIPLPGASTRKIIIQEDRFTFESKPQPEETYFPPQKIFVVITKVERLKKQKREHICYNNWHTLRIIAYALSNPT